MINKTPMLPERAERSNGAFLSVIDSRVLLDYPLICLGSWYPIQCCSLWFKELYLRYDLSIGTLYGAEKRGDWMGGKWYWLAHKLFVLCCTVLYCTVLYCTVCLQVRLLREGGPLQAVPGGHARPRHRQLPRGQPPLLDADPGQSLYSNIFVINQIFLFM